MPEPFLRNGEPRAREYYWLPAFTLVRAPETQRAVLLRHAVKIVGGVAEHETEGWIVLEQELVGIFKIPKGTEIAPVDMNPSVRDLNDLFTIAGSVADYSTLGGAAKAPEVLFLEAMRKRTNRSWIFSLLGWLAPGAYLRVLGFAPDVPVETLSLDALDGHPITPARYPGAAVRFFQRTATAHRTRLRTLTRENLVLLDEVQRLRAQVEKYKERRDHYVPGVGVVNVQRFMTKEEHAGTQRVTKRRWRQIEYDVRGKFFLDAPHYIVA